MSLSTPSGGSISLFDGLALFLASPTSIWWVCQPPLVDQYPLLTDLHSYWLLRRLFGGFVTPSGGSISSFDGLALFLPSVVKIVTNYTNYKLNHFKLFRHINTPVHPQLRISLQSTISSERIPFLLPSQLKSFPPKCNKNKILWASKQQPSKI